MDSEDILIELKELSSNDSIKKSELMGILKKYAHTISVYDLMGLSQRMRKEGEYLDEEMDFTFEDFKMPETFKMLDGMM